MITFRPTAALVAFFGGYAVPAALLFAAGAAGVAFSDGTSFSSPVLSVLILAPYVALPLLAGFLAGLFAHEAPFLHGVAASLLGSVMYGFMHESITLTRASGGSW
jgi:hypothetical protein